MEGKSLRNRGFPFSDKIQSMVDQQSLVSTIYPDADSTKYRDILPPIEIREMLQNLEGVGRFDYVNERFPGVVFDNSKDHTLRCVFRATTLPKVFKNAVRMLWLHDLPEYKVENDLSAVVRYHDKSAALEVENEEKMVARTLFNDQDFTLYQQFQLAEDFVRRSGEEIPKDQSAIIANIIDLQDGNLVFHYFISKWLSDNPQNVLKDAPLENNFRYPLNMKEKIIAAVAKPDVNADIKDVALILVKNELHVTLDLWKGIEKERSHPVLFEELEKMRTLLDSL